MPVRASASCHQLRMSRTPYFADSEGLGVVQHLIAFGMSAAQISKETKVKRDTVNTALAVANS